MYLERLYNTLTKNASADDDKGTEVTPMEENKASFVDALSYALRNYTRLGK